MFQVIFRTQELEQLLAKRQQGEIDFLLVNSLDEIIFRDVAIPGSINVVKKPVVSMEDVRGEGQFILVVDDIAEQREIAVQILIRLGYRVVSVASGDEAVRYVRDNPVDLMVLDMIMPPGMDGLDTYREVLSVRGTRAIIASGFSETERVRKTLALGACLYVRKPYTVEKIAAAVKQALAASPPSPVLPIADVGEGVGYKGPH